MKSRKEQRSSAAITPRQTPMLIRFWASNRKRRAMIDKQITAIQVMNGYPQILKDGSAG
ncbi:hypothetical protein D1872_347170 [compost metagenome]